MHSSQSTALVPVDLCFAASEEVARAGFLAGYRGSTCGAYALDLRQFAVWCADHRRRLFEVHRVDIGHRRCPPLSASGGRYDRGRQSLNRHATYIVATFAAGASR